MTLTAPPVLRSDVPKDLKYPDRRVPVSAAPALGSPERRDLDERLHSASGVGADPSGAAATDTPQADHRPDDGAPASVRTVATAGPPTDDLDAILGPPALPEGVNRDRYWALLERIRREVRPANTLEEIWVRDVVFYTCEYLHARTLRAKFLAVSFEFGLRHLYRGPPRSGRTRGSCRLWASRRPADQRELDARLTARGFDREAVMAATIISEARSLEYYDRWIAAAEARQRAALREIGPSPRDRSAAAGRHRGPTRRRVRGGDRPAVKDVG